MLELLENSDRPDSRSQFEPGHFTASGFVLSADGGRVLLIFHGKLKLWLQPGGHIDGSDPSPEAAAMREVMEETGVKKLRLAPGFPQIIDIDIHDIPPNTKKGEPAHEHFDVRYCFWALDESFEAASDALDAKWVALDEVDSLQSDESVVRAIRKLKARRDEWTQAPDSFSQAVERNRQPIWGAMKPYLSKGDRVLEIASGTGEHGVFFSAVAPSIRWSPSDCHPEALTAVERQRAQAGAANLEPVSYLDVREGLWLTQESNHLFCANMVHISPWESTPALFEGAAKVLPSGGKVFLYGPFKESGEHTADSNRLFDEMLRERDPRWGVRDLEAVQREAERAGFEFVDRHALPANNQLVVFARESIDPEGAR